MIIYLCIKFQSNIPIISKDIAQKPYELRTGLTDGRDGRTYGQWWYYMDPIENGVGIIKDKDYMNIGISLKAYAFSHMMPEKLGSKSTQVCTLSYNLRFRKWQS